MTLDEYFSGYEQSRQLFGELNRLIDQLGSVRIAVTKSQVAFRRRKAFAWAWIPGKYLKGKVAPLVLTISLPARDSSTLWKEVVEPYPGRFMHHLELYSKQDIDEQVVGWLHAAWEAAG